MREISYLLSQNVRDRLDLVGLNLTSLQPLKEMEMENEERFDYIRD